jgi:hypothetical protein
MDAGPKSRFASSPSTTSISQDTDLEHIRREVHRHVTPHSILFVDAKGILALWTAHFSPRRFDSIHFLVVDIGCDLVVQEYEEQASKEGYYDLNESHCGSH